MRKKIKTTIKEYHDEDVICFDVTLITSLLEYVRSSNLPPESVAKIISNIVKHGMESYALTSADYDYIIKVQ